MRRNHKNKIVLNKYLTQFSLEVSFYNINAFKINISGIVPFVYFLTRNF